MANQFRFPGGVHPEEGKALTAACPIRAAPLLPMYVVPLHQHIGAPPKLLVAKGARVARGQVLAQADGFVSVPVHAPTSGEVKGIVECPGPAGVPVQAVEVAADGEDRADPALAPLDADGAAPEALRDRVRDAGLVGMGGAAFPTHVKLAPPPAKKIDLLILNGVECEPYLTADDRLLVEEPERVLRGAAILARVLGVRTILLGIEDNKPEAIRAARGVAGRFGVEVRPLRVRYPQGAEKQLIYALSGRRVPAGGLPMDVGCLVQNVGTAAAAADAVLEGRALTERVTTVTGTPVVSPGNWRVRIGTPLRALLGWAGGVHVDPAKIIFGGPMMGQCQYALDVPVVKSTSGVLLLAAAEVAQFSSEPCIRCGRCLDACPMKLNPSDLSLQIENERFDLAERTRAMDCIECGCCAYACPAHRPLVQHLRRAKAEIAAARRRAAAKRK